MGKPLNWVLSSISARKSTSRAQALRNRLVATTILAVAPFLGYGRQAYAACVPAAAPLTHLCSGPSAGEGIFFSNANVATAGAPPFVVTTDGVLISGLGNQRFIDNNASTSITNNTYYGRGLSVVSLGDVGPTPGAVTIFTNGTISGTAHGIYAYNLGTGDITITANGTVTGVDVDEPGDPETGPDTFIANDGIHAENFGNNLTITTGVGSTVTGEHNGIDARNYGSGDLTITTNGDVTGNEFDAIFAANYGTDLKITIGAQSVVTGAGNGIGAKNFGSGDLEITVNGDVTSNFDGIYAVNSGHGEVRSDNLTITTGAQSVIEGYYNGIDARNFGSEELNITADGVVTGYNNDAIFARNYGTDLTITTGAGSLVRGGGNGIGAYNFGEGDLTITADGVVGGYSEDGDGIHALNVFGGFNVDEVTNVYGSGRNLTITTGADSDVFGGKDGIDAINYGDGDLTINANGTVTGKGGNGIFAFNLYEKELVSEYGDYYYRGKGRNLTITTGAQSAVTGATNGINARNFGKGNLTITVDGTVTGQDGSGITALNVVGEYYDWDAHRLRYGHGDDLTITTGVASVVTGTDYGIHARNFGEGDLTVTANGLVIGESEDGIFALDGSEGDNLTVITGQNSIVTGAEDGIDARHFGEEKFEITVNGAATGEGGHGINAYNAYGQFNTAITVGAAGLVQGSDSGIKAGSRFSQDISITNDGLVRNLSAESDALAITTEGGATHIDNNDTLIGTLFLDVDDPYNDELDNDGFWNTANGASDFGEGIDIVENTGTLLAADDPAFLERTELRQLEEFNNNGGLVSLADGQEGDTLTLLGEGGPIEYSGTNGTLAVDTVLGLPVGADRLSDELIIVGNTDGTTLIHVNVVNATGANLDGIPVVVIEDGGTTAEEHFDLDGPLNGGFFTWDLRYDAGENQHELFTTGISGSVAEFAAGITGAQDMWHQSLGTLMQRQADLRALLGGLAVTPVADFTEPVESTPVAHVTPAFWLKGVGAWLERDGEEDGFILDRKQTIWGGLAGFDFGTENAGEVWMFGLFGGYLTSELEFDETNSEWTYEGPSVGVYATYMDQAFYANATVKADFLDIEIDPEDLAPDADDADTDAVNIGGLIDAGYKFGHEFFIEPQASLAVVHTEIDDVDVFGGTVEFDDETSIRGRLGLRLGADHTGSDATVYTTDVTASVWEEFAGNNDVSITDPVFGAFGASDDSGGTYGDVSLGFSMAAPEGWSSFIRGNYLFGDDFEAFSGNAGVRYAF